ncbi:hypothetical protein BC629DRAFT_1551513 [Irpex lacteus]|nr:hypothetical protein BC629DRAFT_1551513 [Irpex lacteus]
MATVSNIPSLNPASSPFFPGGGQYKPAEDRDERESVSTMGSIGRGSLGMGYHRQNSISRERFATSASTSSGLSVSPTEFGAVKSSPSPPSQDGHDHQRIERNGSLNEFQSTINELTAFRQPPALGGQQDRQDRFGEEANRAFARSLARESSMSAIPEIPQDGDNHLGRPHTNGLYQQNAQYNAVMSRARDRLNTPPVAVEMGSRTSSFTSAQTHFVSSSPASSLNSGSMFAPSIDLSTSLESQLKCSPLIHELFNRMDRNESLAMRDIQRELVDIGRKVDLLFSNPFAPSSAPSFSTPDLSGLDGGPRGSIIGSIPPNQAGPLDDITAITNRFGSLSAAVDHHLANITNGMSTPPLLPTGVCPNDLLPRGSLVPSGSLGHGIPNRPSPRIPGPPSRTWSAGNLDIPPLRGGPNDSPAGSLGRADGGYRDKRRSVAATMLRRDSSAVSSPPAHTHTPFLSVISIQQRALPFLLRGSDIIAQAPPTQERIAAYVIPAIHIALIHTAAQAPLRGPLVVMISTTVDQATQAQRMIRDIGSPIGVRSALGQRSRPGTRLLHQNMPHILCGTPQKLHALFTSPGGISGAEVRFLVLDEVDQLIARNLQDFVFTIVKMLPPPKSRSANNANGNGSMSLLGRRYSTIGSTTSLDRFDNANGTSLSVDRQTALFSNTVPQDVLNLATSIQLREPVRVLVRRDGNFYLYLAFTAGGGRSDATLPQQGLGIIGSGRGASTSAETAQAREWKLDALATWLTALESVVYKLASRNMDVVPLHSDMNAGTKLAALNKFRSPSTGIIRQSSAKVLVVYDVVVKAPDVQQVPLIYSCMFNSDRAIDLPKAVEEYAHRVAPAMAANYSRPGVVVNFVTATGGDVEMLRSIECFYK